MSNEIQRTYRSAFYELIEKIVRWNGDFREPRADLNCAEANELRKLVLAGITTRDIGPRGVENDVQEYIENQALQRMEAYIKKYNENRSDEKNRVMAAAISRRSCVVAIVNFLITKPPLVRGSSARHGLR